jgi:ADP-heptose:LPS heptosyltransferase
MPLKILVMRFSAIGDIVLTSPVARCLHQQLGATVHFFTKKAFAPIVSANPHIQKIHTFEKHIKEALPALRSEQYDWVIDLHHNLRSGQVKRALGRPSRSFYKRNVEKWLLVNFGIDRQPNPHIVYRYMDTVAHLGVRYDGAGLEYHIPSDAVVNLEKYGLQAGGFEALVIGATHATKRLPDDKLIELCQILFPRPVALLGGPAEAETGQKVVNSAGAHVINLCGQLSLAQSASVVGQSARVLTHDTGLMHIAAALHKPIVSIWGNTVPAFGMYPFYPDGLDLNITLEVKDLSCRPCSKIGYDKCPKRHFRCMKGQDFSGVLLEI